MNIHENNLQVIFTWFLIEIYNSTTNTLDRESTKLI